MDLTPLISSDRMVIQAYGSDGFKISGQMHTSNVIVFPDRVVLWLSGDLKDLVQYKDQLDVILYGTGKTLKALLPNQKQGLHIEAMDTGAACRTYNVLMAEGRRVAAALLKN
ncbi:MAG TPA: Mth938-like domain-containing protein [Alphaproteobacteria bacterium]